MTLALWNLTLWVGLAGTAIGVVALLTPSNRRLGLALGCLAASVVSVAAWQLDVASAARDLLVLRTVSTVRVSPAESAPGIIELSEGAVVSTQWVRHGGYLEVETPDGGRGWLASDDAVAKIPR